MIAYVFRLDSRPRISIYGNTEISDLLTGLKYYRLSNISAIRKEVSLWGGAENANVSVEIENGDGLFSRMWESPPLKNKAVIEAIVDGKAKIIFSGVVASIQIGTTLTLTLEA